MPRSLTRRNFLSFDFGSRTGASSHWIRVHRMAMACRFEVMLSSEDASDMNAARDALGEADRLESLLSVFRGTSAVSDLNRRGADEEVRVAPDLFALLARTLELHAETDGAFDVTSTPLSRCWGFLAREGTLPPQEDIDRALAVVGSGHIRLDADRRGVRFDRAGVEVNFGAIGKGYALDRMGGVLRAGGAGRALLSAGRSSVLAMGGRGRGWSIDVRPQLASRRVGRLWLRDGGVGTSGAGEQFVEVGGERYGHVIDPRNGWPAKGVLGVTVIANDAATADALSTAFLIGGTDLAERYCTTHPNTLAVLVLDDRDQRVVTFGRHAAATLEVVQ